MRRLLCVAAVLFLVAGCASESTPRPALPKDRDAASVRAALLQLDPCALLDAVARDAGLPPDAQRSAETAATCDYLSAEGKTLVAVHFANRFDELVRYNAAEFPVDGWKAYREEVTQGGCAVTFPVSFTRGVTVIAGEPLCPTMEPLAAAAAAALGAPDALARNGRGWTACILLAVAVERQVDEWRDSDTESCADDLRTLRFRIDDGYSGGTSTINGQAVAVTPPNPSLGGDKCAVSWPVPDGAPNEIVEVSAADCPTAERFAGQVIDVIDTPERAKPQRPLLYRENEPDLPAIGACAHYSGDTTTCLPAEAAAAPESGDDLLAEAGNAALVCAATTDAVHDAFGKAMSPVVIKDADGERCVFVTPTHRVELVLTVHDSSLEDVTPSWAESTSIAGHPATATSQEAVVDTSHYELAVATTGDSTDGGTVECQADFNGERGTSAWNDPSQSSTVDKAMAAVVERYF